MTIIVDVQYACDASSLPNEDQITHWAKQTLNDFKQNAELTIRLVGEEEGGELNERWRQSKGPTNVLSFPADSPEHITPELLGDIIICAPVIAKEAAEQEKALDAHWKHMIVHGILHLLGYDHIDETQAKTMESLEISILHTIGVGNPYI